MLSIIYFFLGASLGSFIGLVCDRFPEESIVTPSSHCSFCKRSLRFFEMVPVFSQLILKSRCRFCQKPIPYRYLFIELFCGVVCLLFLHHFLDFAEAYFIIFSLCLTLFDLKHQSYPLVIWLFGTTPLIFLGNFYLTFTLGLALAILACLKHLNIGEGDFLYLASASLIFPFSQILLAIEIACLLGLIYFLVSKDLKQKIAFVPFLFVSILFLTFIT